LTDDSALHGDITLEGSDDIGGLLFLVPSDSGVEEEDTDDDTHINPVTETG